MRRPAQVHPLVGTRDRHQRDVLATGPACSVFNGLLGEARLPAGDGTIVARKEEV